MLSRDYIRRQRLTCRVHRLTTDEKSPHFHAGSSQKKKARTFVRALVSNMAVREGFEPSIRCRIHTFQACSFSHSDTSPFCYPVAAGTGANVRKSRSYVNQLFQLIRAFSQTSNNMISKCAESDFFINNDHRHIFCYAAMQLKMNIKQRNRRQSQWTLFFITQRLITLTG